MSVKPTLPVGELFRPLSKIHIVNDLVPPRKRLMSNISRADVTLVVYSGTESTIVDRVHSAVRTRVDGLFPLMLIDLGRDHPNDLRIDEAHTRINVTGINNEDIAKLGLHVNEIARVLFDVFRRHDGQISTLISGANSGVEIAAAAAAVAARVPTVNVYTGVTWLTPAAEKMELPVRVRNQIDAIVGHLK